MKRTFSLKLLPSPVQAEQFATLAEAFARACNATVPFVQEHRCWNRVALHHLAYYSLRERFPELGSQMVCNAIHRVASAYKTLKANGGIAKEKPVPSINAIFWRRERRKRRN